MHLVCPRAIGPTMSPSKAIWSVVLLAGACFPTDWKLLAAFIILPMWSRFAATTPVLIGCYMRPPLFLRKLVIATARLGLSTNRAILLAPRGALLWRANYINV